MTRFIKRRKEIKPPIRRKKESSQKENHIPDTKKKVCSYYKCKKEAIGAYTVDMDISGLGYCKKHKDNISSAMLWTILGVEEMAKHSIGVPDPKNKKQR